MDDTADILGGRTVRPASSFWQSLPLVIRYPIYLSLLLGLYFAALKAWALLKLRQEVNYRMAMRRKHGIPDHDRRPFNVAYAAVLRERQGPEWLRLVGDSLTRRRENESGTVLQGAAPSQGALLSN
jgi:hypothetical protein